MVDPVQGTAALHNVLSKGKAPAESAKKEMQAVQGHGVVEDNISISIPADILTTKQVEETVSEIKKFLSDTDFSLGLNEDLLSPEFSMSRVRSV